ncbi:MAG: alpha/beta fold hydrolase [Eubacterium sp.]|nr:alpha/beta fold hydrolase [Eubacterium sp.]
MKKLSTKTKVIIAATVILNLLMFPVVATCIIYGILLTRSDKKKWNRTCSMPEDEEYKRMHDIGMDWEKKHRGVKTPVMVRSGMYRLFGEYFDFGNDKAVIIIAGRMEACIYSYFFAEPYRRAGYNVLVIDNRAHGLSDGHIVSLGYKEYKDIIAWSRMLHKKFGVKEVVLHGICIGASTALFTLVSPKCPSYVKAMVAEGMYINFYESFKNHMIEKKKPLFPICQIMAALIFVMSGADIVNDGPLKRMPLLRKPILFLHSKEDIYSVPEFVPDLYDSCKAPKKLVWFDSGAHSRIRINHMDKYDDTIIEFLDELSLHD